LAGLGERAEIDRDLMEWNYGVYTRFAVVRRAHDTALAMTALVAWDERPNKRNGSRVKRKESKMRYMVNCSLRPDQSRETFVTMIKKGPDADSWDLVRKRIVVEFAFKVGKVPGFFLLMECASEEGARSHIEQLPAVSDGWLDYQIDPISAVADFD